MKRLLAIMLLALTFPQAQSPGQAESPGQKDTAMEFGQVQVEVRAVLSVLTRDLVQLGRAVERLENLKSESDAYQDDLRILQSSIVAMTAIDAICEFEYDLLQLFLDLRPDRRVHFYEVQLQSLEAAARQIDLLYQLVRVNSGLLPPERSGDLLHEREKAAVESSAALIRRCIALIQGARGQ